MQDQSSNRNVSRTIELISYAALRTIIPMMLIQYSYYIRHFLTCSVISKNGWF